ncbi:hypothetical protein DENIS_1143 [Desulfonema ishimotonii]|uniref:T2SS protein K first SAM-like domain-containing protein n=1 Tax=Desulfonema ishimotonii TaxID=45657 RepID=A0A401FT94_9BACT|nr:helix-hairpin-helix domain-containing protein [Desulfonema ishimotonii]GBC60192.1 hypothetical protein DENIS_1143 [Desulfonema ishimotonii]
MRPVLTDERGVALFMVLWVLVLLSVIVGEFCHTMRTEVNITRNFKEETQAYYIARAGVNITVSELLKAQAAPPKSVNDDDDAADDEDTIRWRVNAEMPAIPFGDGQFRVRIGNESGKININRAEQGLLKVMLNRFELADEDRDTITDSILDWRDRDELHRLNGAESEYYQTLDIPYNAKNGDFDSAEELLLVKGVTPEMFYNGLREMVTVYPKSDSAKKVEKKKSAAADKAKKEKAFDYNRININAASPPVLGTLPLMTEELVRAVAEYRKEEGDFTALSQLVPVLGDEVYRAVYPYVTLETSPLFTIRSAGTLKESRTVREVAATVETDMKLEKKYRIIQWLDGGDRPVQ